jgi:hypothetical protein
MTSKKKKKWKTTSKKNGRRPKKNKKKSTKINPIGCDTIVNSPSIHSFILTIEQTLGLYFQVGVGL